MRERGLKPADDNEVTFEFEVAPHAGAWIETSLMASSQALIIVAPHAGAWIET